MTAMLELNAVSRRFEKKLDGVERLARRLGADLRETCVNAVDAASFSVARGEVVGLVGESGCGKSTLGRMVAGLLPVSDGEIRFEGTDVTDAKSAQARDKRLRIQMIFQDPMSSLNPRMKVVDIVGEAAVYHGLDHARRDGGLCRRAAGKGRARPGLCPSLPAPDVGRPAPAHRHRPRACGAARIPDLR